MNRIVTPLSVGVVVLAAFAVMSFFMVKLVMERYDQSAAYFVNVNFRNLGGLKQRSRVVIAGIDVGHVYEIDLQPPADAKAAWRAQVRLAINKRFNTIPIDSVVRLGSESPVIGDKYVEIIPGKESTYVIDGGALVRVEEGSNLPEMMEDMGAIAKDIKKITESTVKLLVDDEGIGNLKKILNNVSEMTGDVRQTVQKSSGRIDRIIKDFEVVARDARKVSGGASENTDEIIQNIREITKNMKDLSASLNNLANTHKGDVGDAIGKAKKSLDTMQESLENLKAITTNIKEGRGTVGRLLSDDKIVDDLEGAVEGAGQFVERLTRLQTIVGIRSEFHYNQRSGNWEFDNKNAFALRLQPKWDKYYLFELIDDYRGDIKRTKTTRTTSANLATGVNETIIETEESTDDSFRFSLEFAKKLYNVFFRIGIIESSGGVGADLFFFESRDSSLSLNIDLFEFFENNQALRLRTAAEFRFLKYVTVFGGVDDWLSSQERSYYVTAGVRFNDNDLKGLLTVAPTPSTGN